MTQNDLEPLSPQDALDWYLEHRRDSLRTATLRKHTSALGTFVDWTDEVGIDDTNDISGRQLMRFKTWRKDESDLATISLNGNLAILRRFLRFCERIDAVAEGVADRVPLPNVPPNEEVSTEVPANDEVESIRSYFRQFEYASRRHIEFELIAEIGLRMGAIRAIDLGDFNFEGMVVHLRHRPEETENYGTPLKNGSDGERIVNVSTELCDFVSDYVEYNRHDLVADYGREALLTTSTGRVSTATIRRDFYKMTRPCTPATDCPHDREVATCDATKNRYASNCPSGFTTHPLRKWAIMSQLDAGIPKELLSDRVDVSVPVLDKHYDQRTEERKSRRRREELEKHLIEYSGD
jgi:site-specific recombinase XerD